MKKRIVILLAALLVCLLVQPVLAAGTPEMSLALSADSGKPGDVLTVTVSLSETANVTALGLGVTVGDGLEVVDGSFSLLAANVKQSSFKKNSSSGGYVAMVQMDGAQTVSGKLFSFNVKIKDTAALNQSYSVSGTPSLRVSNATVDCTIKSASAKVNCDHSYGAWANADGDNHSHTCAACGNVESEKHAWEGTVTKVNGCDQPGEMTYTCTVCAVTKTETIAPADHVWDEGQVTTAATCAATGEKLFTCASCGTTKTETIPLSTDHSYGAWAKVDDASHTHTCSVCNQPENAAHSWDKGKVTKEPTCAEAGEKTFTCTDCAATKTEPVDKQTTHTYDNGCDAECNVCGSTREPEHKYLKAWSKDKTGHWHPCKVCWTRTDESEHNPGPEATEWEPQVCTDCGYVIKEALGHTHSYADTLTADESGHWYACGGCDEKKDFSEHDYENSCDTDCGVCGHVREIEHDYSSRLNSDESGHWNACTVCGEVLEKQPHVPGPEATETEDQTCQECGYVLQTAHSHEHTPEGDLLSDAEQHWYQCSCGEAFDAAAHTWDAGTENAEAGTVTYLCTVCGHSLEEALPPETEPSQPDAPTDPSQTQPSQPDATQDPAQNQDPGQSGQPGDKEDPEDPKEIDWALYAIIGVCVLLLGGVIFVIVGILLSRKQTGKFSS